MCLRLRFVFVCLCFKTSYTKVVHKKLLFLVFVAASFKPRLTQTDKAVIIIITTTIIIIITILITIIITIAR